MADVPVRVLILLDGDHVAPAKNYFGAKAQGGALIAFQLAEQCRRWISREVGKDSLISCLVFADVAHLCRSMELPNEGIIAFSQGFSATPTPCAFIHVLQGTTLAAITAHLQFLLPTLDFLFLGGFNTSIHAYHLSKLFKSPSVSSTSPRIILLETPNGQMNEGVEKLSYSKTKFQGIAEVGQEREGDIDETSSHEEEEDQEGARHQQEMSFTSTTVPTSSNSSSSVNTRVIRPPSPSTMSRLAVLPSNSNDSSNPWNEFPALSSSSSTRSLAPLPRRSPSTTPLVSAAAAAPVLPPGLFEQPFHMANETEAQTSRSIPPLSQLNTSSPFPGAYPTRTPPSASSCSIPQGLPPQHLAFTSIPNETVPRRHSHNAPSPARSSSNSSATRIKPSPSKIVGSPSSTPTPVPAPAPSSDSTPTTTQAAEASSSAAFKTSILSRATATIPDQFFPLLKLIHSLQSSPAPPVVSPTSATITASGTSPSSPTQARDDKILWSSIGSEISHLKSTKPSSSHPSSAAVGTKKDSSMSSVIPKGVKMKDFLSEAQKQGWVTIGKGEQQEGKEWVKLTKRAERALGKILGKEEGAGKTK
ncbi:uncharacterized protein JCM6883_000315 [Sporobolomyces salmoneus]|uniref:uncharacterized protein n=1 Tax=Sporobolomyces salmoneus TaxID=183962 RepID=UPI00316D8A33